MQQTGLQVYSHTGRVGTSRQVESNAKCQDTWQEAWLMKDTTMLARHAMIVPYH